MAEHCLHGTQIRAIFQKVRGKRVPHGMWRNALPDAGIKGTAFNNLPEALTCQAFPGTIEEQVLGATPFIQTGSTMQLTQRSPKPPARFAGCRIRQD